ncbi:Lytic transglycosylase catalytic [Anaeromyxobacter dehalogenans 2CP-1]|uniref:Lytic transglycosylase catalytic n=1 Tax=Anaeromyxobacter dehalogenans (strain ATCC BAA-258 / DSM 21875 / 2CP-1) TaxID=455488 RepID=B8JFP0_ANAD2|nr:lytic transglycosylase domain-containing protein [Anaeromyxobacter dehalogenans]ACL64478.1 Lytic transglycosylase catalytic [Anaeromyxobacter dehalogenans 2CP-1]
MTGLSALIVACGIVRHVGLIEAIVRVESGGNPFALAVNGAVELVHAPRDRDEAAAMARWLAAHGYNFDAGLAQVNSANLARFGLDTSSVFERCANLRAASRVLEECHERALQHWDDEERAMAAALSCYNTGHLTRGLRNGYVTAVRAAVDSLAPGPNRDGSRGDEACHVWGRSARRNPARGSGRARAAIGDTQRDEVFAMSLADAFATRSHEERVR